MMSKTGIHATLALAFLAQLEANEFAGAVQIADQVGAPRNYLGKLLKNMAARGLVISQKGFGGGFRLARDPGKISLFDIIEPIDQVSKWNGCFLGRKKCSEKQPCAVHHQWAKIREEYLQFLKDTTVAQVAEKKAKLDR